MELDTKNLEIDTSTITIVSPLGLLLSPQKSKAGPPNIPTLRDSQFDFNDIPLDDVPFSAVPLTARPLQRPSFDRSEDRRRSVDSISSNPGVIKTDPHQRPSSTSSVRSATNLPFMLARLDIKKSQEENSPVVQRLSVDGHLKLQEEFVRLQNEEEEKLKSHEAIDWGACYLSILEFIFEYSDMR
jgi:hypothetical protein